MFYQLEENLSPLGKTIYQSKVKGQIQLGGDKVYMYIQLCEDTYAVEQTSWYATNSHTRMKFCVVSARYDPTVLDATSVQ